MKRCLALAMSLLLLLLSCTVLLFGCQKKNAFDEKDDLSSDSNFEEPLNADVTIQNELFVISEEQALEFAANFWKVDAGDVDDRTGYPFWLFVFQSPTAEMPKYKIALRWFVEQHHWSTVDEILVDAVTGECSYVFA